MVQIIVGTYAYDPLGLKRAQELLSFYNPKVIALCESPEGYLKALEQHEDLKDATYRREVLKEIDSLANHDSYADTALQIVRNMHYPSVAAQEYGARYDVPLLFLDDEASLQAFSDQIGEDDRYELDKLVGLCMEPLLTVGRRMQSFYQKYETPAEYAEVYEERADRYAGQLKDLADVLVFADYREALGTHENVTRRLGSDTLVVGLNSADDLFIVS